MQNTRGRFSALSAVPEIFKTKPTFRFEREAWSTQFAEIWVWGLRVLGVKGSTLRGPLS